MTKFGGLYKCQNCNQYFGYPQEFEDDLDSEVIKKGVYRAIVRCECGNTHGIGGERCEYDEGVPAIMMFGFDLRNYKTRVDEELKVYNAVMLIECEESESEAATWDGRRINLKAKETL